MTASLPKCMGVINFTPDSFSDGGNKLHLENLLKFQKLNSTLDIGMESTAPMNDIISAQEEIQRFKEGFLKNIDLLLKYSHSFSFDTYKIEVIKFIVDALKDYQVDITWNDISGSLDQEMVLFLKENKAIKYVFCHNLSGQNSRDIGSNHLQFINEGLDTSHLVSFFENAQHFFIKNSLGLDRIYFDPCFGFSKSFQQNIEIMDNMDKLFEVYPRWVIGISRKSFLQKLVKNQNQDKLKLILDSEAIHLQKLYDIYMKSHDNDIYFRLHDPDIFITFLQKINN